MRNVFIGRTQERKFLQDYVSKKGNDLIILYGRKGIGKTELLRIASAQKSSMYYQARECSEKEQLLSMQKDWQQLYSLSGEELSVSSLLLEAASHFSLMILDEFHLMVKGMEGLVEAITTVLDNPKVKNTKIILCSSSINWVENDMVNVMGNGAMKVSAFLKVKEFTFPDMVSRFPDYNTEETIMVYGILGGVPSYLTMWKEKKNVRENIMLLFLHKDGRLYREAENFLKTELRELALYNTILAVMAEGKLKLNEIYERTGFSRAKISVYIKNLIELDVVEKVFSYDTEGRENTKKGIYRIKDRLIHFWYRFVFPNLSQLEERGMEQVYDNHIAPLLDDHIAPYFTSVCQEYLTLLSDFKRLPFEIEAIGQWYGKEGTIDIIGDGADASFVGKCKWDAAPFTEQDFMELLTLSKLAGVEPEYYYLFSKNGFTKELEALSRDMENVVLTKAEDM